MSLDGAPLHVIAHACCLTMAAMHFRGKTNGQEHTNSEELPSITRRHNQLDRGDYRIRPTQFGIFLLIFLYMFLRFWPFLLFDTKWKWTTYSDPLVSRVTKCLERDSSSRQRSSDDIHLAIVIPFVPKETKQLVPLLKIWDIDGSLPCTTSSPQRSTELVFYISQRFDKNQASIAAKETIQETLGQVKSIQTCFSTRIHFINANLTDEEDEYRDKGSGSSNSGPNIMFYNMPSRIRQELPKVTHVAYVEVDAAYIRNDWIDALYSKCSWNTWVIGNGGRLPQLYEPPSSESTVSLSKSDDTEDPTNDKSTQPATATWKQRKQDLIAFTQYHPWKRLFWYEPARFENQYCEPSFSLNGNAIYTIGDDCFVEFVDRLRNSPLFHISYDHNMYLYRCHPLHDRLTRAVTGKFVQSEVMVDARHLLWNRAYVQSHMKDTFIITQADGLDMKPGLWTRLIKWVDAMVVGQEWSDC